MNRLFWLLLLGVASLSRPGVSDDGHGQEAITRRSTTPTSLIKPDPVGAPDPSAPAVEREVSAIDASDTEQYEKMVEELVGFNGRASEGPSERPGAARESREKLRSTP